MCSDDLQSRQTCSDTSKGGKMLVNDPGAALQGDGSDHLARSFAMAREG
jgi:hypothetical protein